MIRMGVYIYWSFVYIVLMKYVNAFEIDLPTVNVKDSIISLSLRDCDSVKFATVSFYIEGNTNCSGEFVQAAKSSLDSTWTAKYDFKTNLKLNVPFRISTLIELSGNDAKDKKILTKVSSYKIDDQGKLQNLLKTGINNEIEAKCRKENVLREKCLPVETEFANGTQPTQINKLIFDATFHDGYNLSKYWTHEVRSLVLSDSKEYVTFVQNDKHTYIKNGILHLTAIHNKDKDYGIVDCTSRANNWDYAKTAECELDTRICQRPYAPVRSSKIHTRENFSFKYGRIEFRAKMAKGDWLFPYILLQPVDTYAEEPFSSQIRLAYARGNRNLDSIQKIGKLDSSALFGSVLNWENQTPKELYSSTTSKCPYTEDFHNYTVIWHPDSIIYKVDEYEYGAITDKEALKNFQKQCFIVLGLTVNGIANFPSDDIVKGHKKFSNTDPHAIDDLRDVLKFWHKSSLEIEYLRVYATHATEK